MKVVPVATNVNTWKETIKRGLRQLTTGATGKNILPVFEKLHFNDYILFFTLYQQLSVPFSISFTLFNKENKYFVCGRTRRLWNLVPSTWQPDPESGIDGSVCLLLFNIFFSNFIRFLIFIQPQLLLCVFAISIHCHCCYIKHKHLYIKFGVSVRMHTLFAVQMCKLVCSFNGVS